MIRMAEGLAAEKGLVQRVSFKVGDGAMDPLPPSDVVVLDAVICCYPDAEGLLRAAATRTRQLLAFTYPRDCWYVRVITSFQNLMRRMKGNAFRTFVHSPQRMSSVLEGAGLVRDSTRGTLVWMVDLYRREPLAEQARRT